MLTQLVQAGGILLREGIEAILIVMSLVVYLRKAGSGHNIPYLWKGAGFALVASVLTWWMLDHFHASFKSTLVESFAILAAALTMLYVGGWLFLHRDQAVWQQYLRNRADRAISSRSGLGLGLVAFTAVYREGFETVLFLQALTTITAGWTFGILIGLAVAAVALVLFVCLLDAAFRSLPLRTLFVVTSGLMFVIAMKFIGEAVASFQAAHFLKRTEVTGGEWLTAFGLHPTWEAVLIQAAFAAIAIGTILGIREAPSSR